MNPLPQEFRMSAPVSIREPGSKAVNPNDELALSGRIMWVGKLIIFLCTFGFVYPRLLSD